VEAKQESCARKQLKTDLDAVGADYRSHVSRDESVHNVQLNRSKRARRQTFEHLRRQKLMRVLKVMCCAAAVLMLTSSAARADEWNKKTYLTFSGPVQIPGATLPAGTYLFQLADPDMARHVVMVSSKAGDKIYGMFITIPNDRLDAPSENVVMFSESPAGSPQAVQAWWYPGDRIGEEFVYPKDQALRIAKANHRDVLATEGAISGSESEKMAALRGSKVGRVNDSGTMNDMPATNTAESVQKYQSKPATTTGTTAAATTTEPTPAPANTVTGRDMNSAKSNTAMTNTAGSSAKTTGTSGRKRLPRTASNLALFELLSALAIGAGLSLRARRFVRAR
jgi:hypothetical protein